LEVFFSYSAGKSGAQQLPGIDGGKSGTFMLRTPNNHRSSINGDFFLCSIDESPWQ